MICCRILQPSRPYLVYMRAHIIFSDKLSRSKLMVKRLLTEFGVSGGVRRTCGFTGWLSVVFEDMMSVDCATLFVVCRSFIGFVEISFNYQAIDPIVCYVLLTMGHAVFSCGIAMTLGFVGYQFSILDLLRILMPLPLLDLIFSCCAYNGIVVRQITRSHQGNRMRLATTHHKSP